MFRTRGTPALRVVVELLAPPLFQAEFVQRRREAASASVTSETKTKVGKLDKENIKILADERTHALVIMAITHNAVRRFGPVGEPVFYALAGIAWSPVAMLVIWWMARPDPEDETA